MKENGEWRRRMRDGGAKDERERWRMKDEGRVEDEGGR